MLLAATFDLGVDASQLAADLRGLGLPDWQLEVEPALRRELGCTRARFDLPVETGHRHLPEIRERIAASGLPAPVRERADRAFLLLAEAEAAVHRIPVDRVHFHEVGAADAILDICGVSLALHRLGVEELLCGPLPGGSGTVHCAHGELPCPAPAVVELLAEFELLPGRGEGEMVTPTGAALLCAWGRPLREDEPPLRVRATGYGAGTRATSVLRLALAERAGAGDAPSELPGLPGGAVTRELICQLDTHLDDVDGELLAYLGERLFALGAVDVAFIPLTMKKGRPGVALRVLVPPAQRAEALACILRETTALGVREQQLVRTVLTRETHTRSTALGPVRAKLAAGRLRPEYEDLAALARAQGRPLHEVRAAFAAAGPTQATEMPGETPEQTGGETPSA